MLVPGVKVPLFVQFPEQVIVFDPADNVELAPMIREFDTDKFPVRVTVIALALS